ncbi:MAG: glycoside hydrolase family 2 TIM barrel-domain containing protein [Caldilineaceae bacterium]
MQNRKRISLDGIWQFQIDPADGRTLAEMQRIESWRDAVVPMPWQAQFDDLRHTSGTAWYRRTIQIGGVRGEQRAILHFGAVDYQAIVWLNGEKLGEHEGGYLPFEFDATAQLAAGDNQLVVCVIDPTDERSRFAEAPFSEIPHGKQSWYGPLGGIWQSVWLELRPHIHLQRLQLQPDVANASIAITAPTNSALPANTTIQVSVFDPNDEKVADGTLTGNSSNLPISQSPISLWSPENPNLYTVTATLLIDGQAVDQISDHCGFRTIEGRDGRIYLNGQPVYLRGVLDQAYYPGTIYTPPSLEFLEDQARKAKALGLNCLRTHIKIEDPRYYDVADRFGLLIWTEIPNWILLTEETSKRGYETLRQMVERDGNHPSIFAWTLINENWGTDLPRNPEHRKWLADFYHAAKQLDPTRLICDNSACCDNFHVAGDLDDFHMYRAIPDHAKEWDEWVADFAGRPQWAWAADYNHERRPDLPVLVSEFGNWGLPHPDAIQEDGRDPWWFENGHEWGEGIVYPHNMIGRFHYWQLQDVFGSFEDFILNSQEHMAHSLAYEISTMRLHPSIGGYIITELTDVHWECNGLMTMQRDIKHGLETYFTPLNQDRVLVIRPQRWSGEPGETIQVELRASDVDGAGQSGRIHWQVGKHGGALDAPGGVIEVMLDHPGILPLHAHWVIDGTQIATNQVNLTCASLSPRSGKIYLYNAPELAAPLTDLGFTLVEGILTEAMQNNVLIVATRYTVELQSAVQAGAKLLLLAGPDFHKQEGSAETPYCWVVNRQGTAWQGDWATSFSWLNKQGVFAALPGKPLLEMEYADLMPDAVIIGLPAWAMRSHSYAGLALGWIHKPVSLLAELPYGRGNIVMTTFKLNAETLTQHVLAKIIFAGCVKLAG